MAPQPAEFDPQGPIPSVTGSRSSASAQSWPPSIVGREAELALIARRLEALRSGRGGCLALVGEGGIGKTSLATAAAALATEAEIPTFWHRALELAWQPPFHAWIQVLEQVMDEVGVDAQTVPAWVSPLLPLMPELNTYHPTAEPHGSLPANEERFRIGDAIMDGLQDLAGRSPFVVVIDDLQWADVDMLQVLKQLLLRLATLPMLLVVTVRTDVPAPDDLHELVSMVRREAQGDEVRLEGLALTEVGRLMASVSGAVVPTSVVVEVARLTQGNPLYVGEVTRHVVERRRQREGQQVDWLAPGQLRAYLPESLQQVVEDRVRRLAPPVERLVRCAAICTEEFDIPTLVALTGMTESEVLDALDAAIAAHLMTPRPESPETYGFQHQVVREVLYEAWTPSRRVRQQRALAEALQAGEGPVSDAMARHIALLYGISRALPGAAAGVPFALQAADVAGERRASDDVVAWLGLASDLATTMPVAERAAIASRLVLAEVDALQIGPTLDHLEVALRLQRAAGATDGELARFLARVVTGLHDAGASRELWTPRLHEALALVDPDDRLTWARLALLDEQFETIAVDGIAGSRWLGVDAAATRIARASGDEDLFARSMQPWDLWDRAWTEELTDLVDTWQRPTAIVRALMVSGADWLYHHGDFRTARKHFEKLLVVARQQGSIQGQGDAWVRLAVIHAALGDAPSARQCEREATVFIERLGRGHHLHASLWWARAYLCELERLPFDAVAEFFRDYIGDPDVRKRTIPFDDASLATLALLRIGQVPAATHLLQSLVTLLGRIEPDTWLLNGAVGFAGSTVWELDLASPAPTILQATRAAMDAGHGDYPGCSNHLTVARMHVLLDQPDVARRWFMLAREHLDQSGQRAMRVRVDLDEATALARGNAVGWSVASSLARRAAQGYRDLGLEAWAERAERLATEVDGRARQHVPIPGGISDRERHVVELVAQGLSDREIAAAMYLSPRTVNAHLRNIYVKTGARNRTDLTRWAVREGLIPARDAS